jgi:hypothetical protein
MARKNIMYRRLLCLESANPVAAISTPNRLSRGLERRWLAKRKSLLSKLVTFSPRS